MPSKPIFSPILCYFFRLVQVSVNHVSISLLHHKLLGLRFHTFFTLYSLSLSLSQFLSLPTKIVTIYNTWLALSNMLLYYFQVVSVPVYLQMGNLKLQKLSNISKGMTFINVYARQYISA